MPTLSALSTQPQSFGRRFRLIEFAAAVAAAVSARNNAHGIEHYHQAKVAEDVLVVALIEFADGIRQVGARKGESNKIGARIATQLEGPSAAALAVLWSIRSARLAGIYSVFRCSAHKPGFGGMLKTLLPPKEIKRLIRRIGWHGAIAP